MTTLSPIRAAVVLLAIIVAMTALAGRVAYLQTYGRQQTIRRAERQQHMTETLQARRGNIWDRTGVIMAGTVQSRALYVDPKFMLDCYQADGRTLAEMDDDVSKLARLIDRDPYEVSQLLSDKSETRFVRLADHLDNNVCAAIDKLDIPGVGLMPTSERYYPMGSLAAHLLGGVGSTGNGLEGLELQFDKQLAGRDGAKRSLKDARRHALSVAAEDFIPAEHGRHLVLTIDANIQMIAEQELAAACQKYKAPRGEAVVMDPQTGEILAMADWPAFNPGSLNDSPQKDRLNRAIVVPYEPGSTLKPFIVGPALAQGVTRLREVWPIPAKSYKSPLRRKPITDVHFYGPLATWDVLVKSSNIGMTMIGERLGKSRLFNAVTGFGFGRRTGVEMPGEDAGAVNPLARWHDYSIPSVAQGYELMVTPLQLARAMCAYGNGGRLVTPRLVQGPLDPEGALLQRYPEPDLKLMPQAVDPVTAAEVRRVLCDVVVRGTSTGARSYIWNIFGKTGTSHISQGAGGYADDKYNSSFIGGAPAENPRLVIALCIHEPDRSLGHYGGTVAGPAAGRTLERALAYLQVPPSPDLPLPPADIASSLVNYNPSVYKRPLSKGGPGATASAD